MTFDEFKATRRIMSAQAFGELVGDLAWESEPDTQFYVYGDSWWIEILANGDFCLTIENGSWIATNATELESLELRLWEFATDMEGEK